MVPKDKYLPSAEAEAVLENLLPASAHIDVSLLVQVQHMTPTAANALVEATRLQHAVPAEEKTKQAAEETKRAAEETKRAAEETKRAAEETKRAMEETKRETEVTKREETLAKHQTWRHIFVFIAVLAGLLVVALRDNAGGSVAAIVAILGGVYAVDRVIDRMQKKALPKGGEAKQLE